MAEETTTIAEFAAKIVEESGVDPKDIAHVTLFVGPRNDVWEIGKACPVKTEVIVFGMFLSGEDVRVYCVPTQPKDAAGKIVPFMRLTLSRQSGSLVGETLAPDVFKAEMAEEIIEVAREMGLDEPEEEPTVPAPNGDAGATATPQG